jgi:AcrR family transcriptional regulator
MTERSLSRELDLVAAARRVLLDKGLAGATTKAICRAAGCAEGTLYLHFDDKLDLFGAVLGELLPAFLAVTGPLPARAGSRTVEQNLREVAEGALALYRELLPLAAAIFAEPELLARHRADLRRRGAGPQRAHEPIAEYLRAEQALGRVDPGADPAAAAVLLLGACHHHAFMESLVDAAELPLDRPDPAAAMVAAVLAGLAPRDPASRTETRP